MIRKFRFLIGLFLLSLLAVFSIASRPATLLYQAIATPTPKVRATLVIQGQAGNSDGIVFLGILIFVFIAIPLLLKMRNSRS
jgi:hypothetical protein